MISITEFNNSGDDISRNAAKITRKKFLRFFNNLILDDATVAIVEGVTNE